MKLKFLCNCVADKKPFYIGEVADISEKDSRYLIQTKRAVEVKEQPQQANEVEQFINQGLETETREMEIRKSIKKRGK